MWKQAVEWLAAAATDPQECKREWDHGKGTALLAAGRYWDVRVGAANSAPNDRV